ncbi:MAG: translesion error-prone DNA polymerase V autoproteolytic subunit [Ignavibacteria bacterium]|jgi:DNA polymerase V|nr:translesion error-prone DNA polymerase V autoproteolytic subunit [Ignavibacteria bacterium]MBK9227680.1 translesion error-prone DNA polymerase V autoproteolytic subunit [Ignavibacteria bacterium]
MPEGKLEFFKPSLNTKMKLKYVESLIHAGFPSPAFDYLEKELDLNEYLIKHPSSTFLAKVTGDSMIKANLKDGDLLIIDKAKEPKTGDTVVAVVEGEFTVKKLRIEKGRYYLVPENDNYKPIEVTNDTEIWGVVIKAIISL